MVKWYFGHGDERTPKQTTGWTWSKSVEPWAGQTFAISDIRCLQHQVYLRQPVWTEVQLLVSFFAWTPQKISLSIILCDVTMEKLGSIRHDVSLDICWWTQYGRGGCKIIATETRRAEPLKCPLHCPIVQPTVSFQCSLKPSVATVVEMLMETLWDN